MAVVILMLCWSLRSFVAELTFLSQLSLQEVATVTQTVYGGHQGRPGRTNPPQKSLDLAQMDVKSGG